MIEASTLVPDLTRQVLRLDDDLRTRLSELPVRQAQWRAEHGRAVEMERTATSWQAWRDERVTQAAVAWVLTTVFVRFCEDNRLLTPVWISGPGERRQEALDAQLAFFRQNPELTDREWLRQAVDHLARTPATRDLVDSHSALRTIEPSGRAATALLDFWRQRDDAGAPRHDFADPSLSTRFLGDLYQDLSAHAKATYALLQTPVFVEEFILDRTLDPALAERPLDGFRLIDPACGSGHFLLGAFARLLDRWDAAAPGVDVQSRVQIALHAVHGVDLNPFAVAISRFRLTVEALRRCGLDSLERAPDFAYHVAAGDSLLIGTPQPALPLDGDDYEERMTRLTYSVEDLAQLRTILQPGRYDVVVGNPPYITVKDRALNAEYRRLYPDVCKGKYAMTVPFLKRFFQLARPEGPGQRAGWVGQITSNSFLKREFGSKLIEQYLPTQDLRLVADTSGAYIPGHGTPTVILVGRSQAPSGLPVRAVLGIRGEPGRPTNPARGLVWSSLVDHVDEPGYGDEWLSVVDLDPARLATHPWSLNGGVASELLQQINESASSLLRRSISRVGFFGIMGSNDAMVLAPGVPERRGLEEGPVKPLVVGDVVRDYAITSTLPAWFPYSRDHDLRALLDWPAWSRHLWPLRAELASRERFSGGRFGSDEHPFYEWHQLPKDSTPLSITFAFVATHNHFVLDRGGKAFSRSAPVIKLPEGAAEDDHVKLLGVLNSSVACFWLKQRSHNKGSTVDNRGARQTQVPWEDFYEFTGTTLQDFPLPTTLPPARARHLDTLAQQRSATTPDALTAHETPTALALKQGHEDYDRIRSEMIVQQEELDWKVYGLYGLPGGDLTYDGDNLPGLELGQRAFEIALARRVTAGEESTAWFTRHASTPVTEIPEHWPAAYRDLVQRRLDLIAADPQVALLEKPEHKRRWASESWEAAQQRALRNWLLDRLEDRTLWYVQGRPTTRSVGQLTDVVGRDEEFVSVLSLWEGRPDVRVETSLTRLLADEAVPFLAAYRLKESGLRTFEAWQHTWELQRREDRGEDVGTIPVPPKYTSADFRRASFWQARGKLDVPKERFVAYPDAGRAADPTPLLGWAGWDHAEQFLALATVVAERTEEGWPEDRLEPLVAGLAELQPWVAQWHTAVDPTYGVAMADFCAEQLAERCRQIDRTPAALAAWRPVISRGRKARR